MQAVYNNILITGSQGQLGRSIKKLAGKNGTTGMFRFIDIDDLDLTDGNSVRSFVSGNKIDFVVNCAAYTAVDRAETEAEQATRVNSSAPGYLAGICREYDVPMIHISTDFIFDGKKHTPYNETDDPRPLSVYGNTKLDGEKEVIKRASTFAIIRTSWLYSEYGKNFVRTMLDLSRNRKELGVVYDQVGTPTYAGDLAAAVLRAIPRVHKGMKEIFHYSNEGVASWYDFAKAVFDMTGTDIELKPIETADYPTPAKRPAYSVMNKAKFKKYFKTEIPYWRDSLGVCLKNIKEGCNE